MVKTKARYVITLIAVFIAMCLLNVSTVQAAEITETDLQAILDLIPSTMELDIPEIEYEKADSLVKSNINKILDTKGYQFEDSVKLKDVTIDGYNIEINTVTAPIYLGVDNFYTASVSINVTDGNTIYSKYTKNKSIKLIYNNHSNYNPVDENIVKNIKLENKRYIEVDLDYKVKYEGNPEGLWNYFDNLIAKYYTDVINDSSIVVKAGTGAGTGEGVNLFTAEHGTDIGIFKNGNLYEIRKIGHHATIPVINVPNTMTDTEINAYVIQEIKDTYSNYGQYVTGITKGVDAPSEEYTETYGKIPDIYTVNTSAGPESIIIIRRYETGETKVQKILDAIPSTMELDIPEIEYKNASELITTNVKKILDTKGIKYEVTDNIIKLKEISINGSDVKLEFSNPVIYLEREDFYIGNVLVNYQVVKEIKLKYNNTDKYNAEDEAYIKNLKIENPKYFEVDFFHRDSHYNTIENYYTKLINDSSIGIIAEAGSGGFYTYLNTSSGHGRTCFGIFKNGVLYDVRVTDNDITIPVINVPSSFDENEVNKYVINMLKEHYKEYGDGVTSITKGVTEEFEKFSDIPDIYTVNAPEENYGNSIIIIRKEQPVTSSDNETKIKFETTSTVVPEDTKLVVDEVKEESTLTTIKDAIKEISNKYVVFDISLIHNNKEIQPNGKVKISIPVPSGYDTSNLVVFRVESDGTKFEFKVNVVEIDGTKYAQFETDHFSNYVLAEKTTEKAVEQDNSNRVLDDQPKTGIIDFKVILGIVMVAFTVIVVKNKRKNA